MDVIKLNPSTYLGEELVRGWTNMIWTERFLPAGEFELRTPLVEWTRNLIPEDSLISLRDSREVMRVEDLEIETDDDGIEELKVTGRTEEAPLFENRLLGMGSYREPFRTQPLGPNPPTGSWGYTATEAAGAIAWDMLANVSNWSVLKPEYGNDPRNAIPNLSISMTEHLSTAKMYWWLENGPAYAVITDFLSRGGAGVRMVRPPNNPATSSTEFLLVYPDGSIARLPADSYYTNRLQMDFYKGVNRSEGTSNPVVFDYRLDHLEKTRYLFSSKNLRNIGVVKSKVGDVTVYANDEVSPYLTGRARRYLYIDGGDPGDIPLETFLSGLVQKGEIELAKYNRIAAMESGVSATAPAKYGVHYGLGDLVTLRGNHGFNQRMQVTEYVRTSNGFVDEGYPTLTLPTFEEAP